MPVSQMQHPDLDKLTAFGLGLLSEADSAEIERHLSECAACCEKLEYLPADSLVDLLQASEADTPSDLSASVHTVDSGSPASAPASLPPLFKRLANIVGGKSAGEPVQPSPAKVAAFYSRKIPSELAAHSRYEVLEHLGAGGMGAVYKAKHRLMDRMVAIKIVNPLLVTKPGAVDRFIREVKAAAQLTHPNIVTAYDAEAIGEMHVLVMEYVEGETLAELLQEQGVLGVSQACDYIRQAALGLQHAVDRGMVHRDIKPQNLMLTRQRSIKILDFGLARFVSEQTPLDGTTEQGSMMGSPDYMAPEQARDAHTADARADIYSLGCTLYQLLAGQVPFPVKALLEKLEAHRDEQPSALNELRLDVPAELERIIAKMMAKNPDERHQTPAEVADALLPFTKEQPHAAPVEAKPESSFAPRKHARSRSDRRQFAEVMFSAFPKSKLTVPIAVGAGLLFVLLGYWAAQIVFRIETPQGTLIVKTDDSDVQVSVRSGGKQVALFFPKEEKEVQLEIGTYTLELVGGKDGLQLSTNKLEIKSGSDEKTVTVEFVPTVAAKETLKSDNKAEMPAAPTLPAIPSVEELLKTREVLTVAQDGSGGYKTIGEALDNVKAGQVVQVMDKGPYREFIGKDLPADVALVSLVSTRIEIPKYTSYAESSEKGKFHYYGASLRVQSSFRLSGFEWVGAAPRPENLVGGSLLFLGAAGDMVVERCSFRAPDYLTAGVFGITRSEKPALLLVQDNFANQPLEFREIPGSLIIQRNWISSSGWAMIFNPRADSVLIRHNVVNANYAISFYSIVADKTLAGPGVALKIHNNVLDAAHCPIVFWNEPKETCVLPRSAFIANNIIRSATSEGVLMIPEDMALVKDRFEIGPNVYHAAPKKTAGSPFESWPISSRDLILAKQFLSDELNNADYLRIAADGPLATGGAGGDLPTYFGAFPPGPAPKDGDWFTRLKEDKLSTVKDLVAKARAASDLKQFDEAVSLCNEALRLEPNHIEALYWRAWPKWNLGKRDEAIQDLTVVLSLNPAHWDALDNRSFYYLNTGKLDECIADSNRYLSLYGTSSAPRVLANRGTAYAKKGRFDRALADYDEALKRSPESIDWYLGRGFIHERLGNVDLAKADLAKIAELKPEWKDRTNDLLDIVPQPVPLAEWREGREFLTVAQKGPADHRTIQDALNTLKAGQYVKVLDKGPYRETLIYNRGIADIALVSDVGTRVEVPHWHEWGIAPADKEKKVYQGCVLVNANGFRLSGFEFRLPPLPPDADSGVGVDVASVGDLIIESSQMRFHGDLASGLQVSENPQIGRLVGLNVQLLGGAINEGQFLVQDNLIDGRVELRDNGPVRATVQRNWIRTGHSGPTVQLPLHEDSECSVRNNIIQGFNGIALRARSPKNMASMRGRYLIANNLIDVAHCPFYAWGANMYSEDRPNLIRSVTIQNNAIRSESSDGIELTAEDLNAMTGVWKIGHNCFRADPRFVGPGSSPVFPKQPTDLIVAGPFLSDDPQQADYPRIPTDSRLATGGVGGNLPSYIGPLPPGPAPQEGDWFTRLQKVSAGK